MTTNERLWMWNWVGGGYNTTFAETRDEALANAHEMGKPGKVFRGLEVDESTLREVTDAEVRREEAKYAGMFD